MTSDILSKDPTDHRECLAFESTLMFKWCDGGSGIPTQLAKTFRMRVQIMIYNFNYVIISRA